MAVPTVRTATAMNIGSAMRGPLVVDYDLDVALVLGLNCKLARSVNQVLFGKGRQLVIIGHEKSVERTSIDTQSTKDALAIVYLGHDALLVLLPLLVDFDHAYRFGDTLAGDCAQLASGALVVEQDVPAAVASYADASLWVELEAIAHELELLLRVAQREALDN